MTTISTILSPWDYGVRWFSRRTVAPTEYPITVEYFTNRVLKSANGNEEDALIEAYIIAATEMAEDWTQRALMPQTWEMVLDGFPASGVIALERPPLIGYPTLTYYDEDGDEQAMDGSPVIVDVSSSGKYAKARIRPLDGEEWPATYGRLDAVTVTYEAGFSDQSDPELQKIAAGIGLKVLELYDVVDKKIDWQNFWRRVY